MGVSATWEGGPGEDCTDSRATLVCVAHKPNVTLSVPRELLEKAKRLAVDTDWFLSALVPHALSRMADQDRRNGVARKRALNAMRTAPIAPGVQVRKSFLGIAAREHLKDS